MSDRITDLEIKIAFVENAVAELDGVVRAFGLQLDELRNEIVQLREAMPEDEKFNPEEEVPPHY